MNEINKREPLSLFLTRKIREIDSDFPEDEGEQVEYIRKWREKYFYPNTRFDAPIGLYSFTRNELNKIEKVSRQILSEF